MVQIQKGNSRRRLCPTGRPGPAVLLEAMFLTVLSALVYYIACSRQSTKPRINKPKLASLKSRMHLPPKVPATLSAEKRAELEKIRSTPVAPHPNCTPWRHTSYCLASVNAQPGGYFSSGRPSGCHRHEREDGETIPLVETNETCKTLWFAGFHPGDGTDPTLYANYATSLLSARHFAADSLQPVLLFGEYGAVNETTKDKNFKQWANSQGAIVISVQELSFQQDIEKWHGLMPEYKQLQMNQYKQGPYMKLDVRKLIGKHALFRLPGICDRHVLYTDSDVMFANKITHSEIATLKSMLHVGGPFLMYGREGSMEPLPLNTGVMMLDLYRFGQMVQAILEFGREKPQTIIGGDFDQSWLNAYLSDEKRTKPRHKAALLPLYWNWRLYWRLEPSTVEDIRLIHFQGNKPGDALWSVATCSTSEITNVSPPLARLLNLTLCCDIGQTAYYAKQLFDIFQPDQDSVNW
jgi:hypothetical protein